MGKSGLSHVEEGWEEVWDEKPVITFIEMAHLQTTGKIRQVIVTRRVASCSRKYAPYESCLPFGRSLGVVVTVDCSGFGVISNAWVQLSLAAKTDDEFQIIQLRDGECQDAFQKQPFRYPQTKCTQTALLNPHP